MITAQNLLTAEIADRDAGETMESLLTRPGLILERIVSRGCPTPVGQWYDQEQDEWVLLVGGTALLEIERQTAVTLRPGDHLLLPARVRHRVAEVSDDAVWLALHISPSFQLPTGPETATVDFATE